MRFRRAGSRVPPLFHAGLLVLFLELSAAVAAQIEAPYRFAHSGKYGFRAEDGAVRVAARFDDAREFREGLAAVAFARGRRVYEEGRYGKRCYERALHWGYIDQSGRQVIAQRFDDASSYSEGLAAVASRGAWGYIDVKGQWIVRPAFSEAGPFLDGVARVTFKDNGRTGYIDRSGRIVAAAGADGNIEEMKDGAMVVSRIRDRSYSVIDRNGNATATQRERPVLLGEGLFAYRPTPRGPAGLMGLEGNVVATPMFDALFPFSNGLALARWNTRYGYVDAQGRPRTEPSFIDAGPFSDGLANVCVDTGGALGPWDTQHLRCGYIETSGAYAISPRFQRAEPFQGPWATVEDPVFGLELRINRRGKIVDRMSWKDEPSREPSGVDCHPPAPAPPPRDYSVNVSLRSTPSGASVFLVPLWDWEQHQNGTGLLANADALSTYLVPQGATPLASITLKAQVYMGVFELAGQRKISRLVVAPNASHDISVIF